MFKIITIPLLLCLVFPVFAQTHPDTIVGKWEIHSKKGDGLMEIYKRGSTYYGKLIWGDKIYDEHGNIKCDLKNPNPALRSRSLEHLEFLTNFHFNGKNQWDNGYVYDFTTGKTYRAFIRLKDPDTLIMSGYVGIKLLRQSVTWKRAR